ncbi:uncharacterized protein YbiU [Lepeophtheirus salmonis]|uniref:uncharacterized protein YbiU n=1 Tax=Lepeophtheirus salmonis TaxID=72036 RepID=UPI001AE4A822|nr:uncharacterized protein YbiU-like [Lepeophtheirus salmonis]
MNFERATLTKILVIILLVFKELLSTYTSDNFAKIKSSLNISIKNEAWNHLIKRLEKRLDKIWAKEYNNIIPEIQFQRLLHSDGQFPESIAHKIRKRGIIVIRNVVKQSEIQEEQSSLIEYIFSNQSFDENDTQKLDTILWSKPQQRLRQNSNLQKVEKALLQLFFTKNNTHLDLKTPITLVDGLRIRIPSKNKSVSNKIKMVSGQCIERWRDPAYHQVYRHLLHSQLDDYDPFEMDHRLNVGKNTISRHTTIFRPFQGWIAMSHLREGSLEVFPILKEATGYFILRPFMKDIPNKLFPGCLPGKPLELSPLYHPLLYNNMIPIPALNPGDTVWWHEDLIYSESNDVETTESAIRLLTGPDCEINRHYLRKQRHSFTLKKKYFDEVESNNVNEKGFNGGCSYEDLSSLGKRMMGWSKTDQIEERNQCYCT